MNANWMTTLARHYAQARSQHPDDSLLLLFDIDGTILDSRYSLLYLFQTYDLEHGTRHFRDFTLADVEMHERDVGEYVGRMAIDPEEQARIVEWFRNHRWSHGAVLESHRPYQGVLEVIRWFQLQPNTFVGLNTGRPEAAREETLRSLNELGKEWRVAFDDALLVMNPDDGKTRTATAKALGLRRFQDAGYRIIAMIDNEPSNLEAIAAIDPEGEILLLHADTIFHSKRESLPARAVPGVSYSLRTLLARDRFGLQLPRHIEFVWHGLSDWRMIDRFGRSSVRWGECNVRLDRLSRRLVVRSSSLADAPMRADEEILLLDELLSWFSPTAKGLKLDLKMGGESLDLVLRRIEEHRFPDERLWFHGRLERIEPSGFRRLSRALPGAIIQCPIDFLTPLVLAAPDVARGILDRITSWGVTRVSVSWQTPRIRRMIEQLDAWGFEINVHGAPDLEAFLQAALLLPRSISARFELEFEDSEHRSSTS
ncbi:HAD family hydrolase [Candidatus Bipolaricaulota bacterium]|nr:HAD family hydrolase [Candidatus Bipolaricaulota bacterium]